MAYLAVVDQDQTVKKITVLLHRRQQLDILFLDIATTPPTSKFSPFPTTFSVHSETNFLMLATLVVYPVTVSNVAIRSHTSIFPTFPAFFYTLEDIFPYRWVSTILC